MLFKLSLGNIRRSVRDYAIYFFTLLIGVSIFYVFNAIETQTAFITVSSNTKYMIELMTNMLSAVSVFVSCVLGGLIVYASRFLMRRRNKEFALYMMLGMGKGKVSGILLTETLIVGAVSLGAGLLLGVGLSQLMSAFVVSLFDADMTSYRFTFSGGAAVKAVIYFGLIYVVTMLFNAGAVGKFKLIDLMRSDKKAEVQKLKNPAVCVVVFILAAAMLGYAYYKVAFDFGSIDEGWKMLVYIAMGAVSTFLIFWSVSGMLMRIVMSSKRTYYRGLNSFTFRQIGSRINTMVMSATIICLMLFVTICMLAAAFSLKKTLDESVEKNAPVDVCVEMMSHESTELDIKEMYAKIGVDIDEYLSEYVEFREYTLYDFKGSDFFGEYIDEAFTGMNEVFIGDVCETAIHLSDYNKMAELYGLEQLSVADDEYAVAANFGETMRARNIPLSHGNEITIRGRLLKPAYPECKYGFDMISNTAMNTGILIIPDSLTISSEEQTDGEMQYSLAGSERIEVTSDGQPGEITLLFLSGNYKAQSKEEKRAVDEIFSESDRELFRVQKGENGEAFGGMVNTRIEITDSAVGLGAIATFLGLYIGVVFLISCGAILAIKALSENIDSIPRYDILRKIGAEQRDIDRSLFRQTGIFFLLPLLLAIIHSVFGMKFAMNILTMFGAAELLPAMLLTSAIILVIYGGYFLITYYCGKVIIRSRS